MTDRELVLWIARSQVNVTEVPPNTNKGLKVEDYLATVGLSPGQPWCAAFVAWVGVYALGGRWPVPKVGGCALLGEWAAKKGLLKTTPEAGDVFLLYFPKLKRFAHTGFILSAGTECVTVEGNTSGAGSREGWGVFERKRTFGPDDRFIRWEAKP